MADSTNLSLGPNSTLKLDRTVFDDAHSYRDISIKLTTGAFRFVTGHSEKAAYKIQTQVATIGVRGTILDILSQRGKTTVVLRDNGASRVCTLTFQCTDLTKPGDTAIITFAGGKYTIQKSSTPPWTFACAVPRRDFAAPPSMPMHRRRLRRLSMTAAIPPACCAGADDGKIRPQFYRCRLALAAAISLMLIPALTIPASAQSPTSPSPTPSPSPSPSPTPTPLADARRRHRHRLRPPTGSIPAPDRSRIWPSSASTR